MTDYTQDTLIFDTGSGDETAYGGFGNDLMNADDTLETTGTTGDSEWRYVPVRRTAEDDEGDIAGNFRDTSDGEIEVQADPYSNFNFTVDWG